MWNRSSQQQGARTSNHPKEENNLPILWIQEPIDAKGTEQYNWNPDGCEAFNGCLQTRWFISESMNGFNQFKQLRFFTNSLNLEDDRTTCKDETCLDKVSFFNINRNGFSRQGRLVQSASSIDDTAIGWNKFTTSYFDKVADGKKIDGHLLRF